MASKKFIISNHIRRNDGSFEKKMCSEWESKTSALEELQRIKQSFDCAKFRDKLLAVIPEHYQNNVMIQNITGKKMELVAFYEIESVSPVVYTPRHTYDAMRSGFPRAQTNE